MSTGTTDKKAPDFPGVDPLVSESLDSALGQLHLEELDQNTQQPDQNTDSASTSVQLEQNVSDAMMPPSHMFPPHPQMIGMGFIPFSQMMAIPHHTGFFPPSDFNKDSSPAGPAPGSMPGTSINTSAPPVATVSQGTVGPVLFNNSNDASMFATPNGLSPGFTMGNNGNGNGGGSGDGRGNDDDNQNTNARSDVNAPPQIDPLWNGAPLGVAIDDSSALEDGLPQKTVGGNNITFRRQTFHALSPSELMHSTGNSAGLSAAEPMAAGSQKNASVAAPTAARRQSVHMDKMFSSKHPEENVTDTDSNNPNENDSSKNSKNFAAAYPYGGPLLQPNPILSGHHPPASAHAYGIPSPFPAGAYGFTSPFQSFSPVLGTANTSLQPNSSMTMAHSPLQVAPVPAGDPTVDPLMVAEPTDKSSNQFIAGDPASGTMQHPQAMQMGLHQQGGGTPPPWIYGGHPFGMVPHPHAVPQKPPHVMGPPVTNSSSHNVNLQGRRGNTNNRAGRSGHPGNGRGKHNKNYSHHYYGGTHSHENHQRKLEENSRYANATLDQFIGNIYSLCKDQHGCRFLQMQLDMLGPDAADAVFEETREHTVELMTDSFGNYLVQKLLEKVTIDQRRILARIAAPHFVRIASNPHGTRALQKLVECVNTDEEARIIVDSLNGSIVELSKDLNGNHIVQKCLQKLQPKDVQFIFDAACKNCTEIATHRHGCCVLQRCLDHGTKSQCEALCNILLKHVDHLTLDPFGNYVVQYIITKETEQNFYDYTYKIVHLLKPKVIELSLHKFGSNVIEKIIRTPVVSETMILEILKNRGEPDVQALLNDGYGNYVLQTALDVSHESNASLYARLAEIVRPLMVGPIKNTPHGRRIMGILQLE
ncbi:related to Pumilio homology domain family member 4 [Zygosaccharomyces bailii]|nr:related to Pumilio homology domain family member 4 [Zygosaccharomyces bailii]